MLPGRVLDVSALIEIAVAKTEYSRSIAAMCLFRGGGICIPATSLAAVLSISPISTQVELFELVTTPGVVVDDFTYGKVGDIAEILDGSRDITAGHAVWCARNTKWPILTDRGEELSQYDQHIMIDPLP
ncbi:hypothetical protein AB0D67_29940 [Streptosporangium sp. NPDC048047]|uniref:hypothetical protein n=1 Tax=unclassified Streptosporangium TaxID=2632669 RepID=UPI00344AE965